MIIEPKIINNVCLTSHPLGCAAETSNQIAWASSQAALTDSPPKRVLVVGGSTGYGLASRIVATFAGGAETISVSLEKEPTAKKTGSPGWYNNREFERQAQKAGQLALSLNGDAFSQQTKEKVISLIKEKMGAVDLLIYSLASPVRVDPDTGESYRSVLKPIGQPAVMKSADFLKETVSQVSVNPANEDEIRSTVKVMGGEDWSLWVDALLGAKVASNGFKTVAYSYVGSPLTAAIYREGTIGKAKEDLERRAAEIGKRLESIKGEAYVSINKALMTRASAVIPGIALYMALLFRIMKEEGCHEGCIEQIYRLFKDRLYSPSGEVPTDEKGRIRVDDWEMRPKIQERVRSLWEAATTENLKDISDIEGVRLDYLRLHGFMVPGLDYDADL